MKTQSYVWHPNTQMSEWSKFPKIIRGEGMWLIDDDGNRFLDGVASMWCNVWGHSKQELISAITNQAKKLQHSSSFNFTNEPIEILAKKIGYETLEAINALGVSSTYTSATRTIIGATATPSDVSELSVSMVGSDHMQLQWTPVTDLDVSYYAIRYQDVTSGAGWNSSTNLTQVVRRKSNSVTINARTGAFLIKAVLAT